MHGTKGCGRTARGLRDPNQLETDKFPSTEELKRLGTLFVRDVGCVWSRERRGVLSPADTKA